ncbi:MAG: DUF3562 domain-containing protein [Burkholderiales bacterium]
MAGHYNDSEEQGNSIEAILEIAQLTRRPVAEVKEVYEFELARLKSDARIMDYARSSPVGERGHIFPALRARSGSAMCARPAFSRSGLEISAKSGWRGNAASFGAQRSQCRSSLRKPGRG